MKQAKFLFVLVLGIMVSVSCSKDNDDVVSTPPSSLAGVFVGMYGTGTNAPSTFYSFNLKASGTMEELDVEGKIIGTGSWTITGTTFRATHHYTFPVNSFFVTTGTYNASTKTITGTWGYGSSDNDGGKWHMTKK